MMDMLFISAGTLCVCVCVRACMCVHVCLHMCVHVCVSVCVFMCCANLLCMCVYNAFFTCVQCMYTCFHRKCAGINIKYLLILPDAMSNLGMIIDSYSVNIYF